MNYKFVEEVAFYQRRDYGMQTKIMIGNNRFILKSRPKTGAREQWKDVPEFIIDNAPKISMSPRPRPSVQPPGRSPLSSPQKKNLPPPPPKKTADIQPSGRSPPRITSEPAVENMELDEASAEAVANVLLTNHTNKNTTTTKQTHTPPDVSNPKQTKVHRPIIDNRQKIQPIANRQKMNTSSSSNISSMSSSSRASRPTTTPHTSPSKALKIQMEAQQQKRNTKTDRTPTKNHKQQ